MLDDGGIEATRLYTLKSYQVLDTLPEAQFDAIVGEAVVELDTPIALISLIDEDRQWFKARIGLPETEMDRSISFCSQAIKGREVFVVEDATCDERFASNPLVIGHPCIRFYAGAPLTAPNGSSIGTLCVIDTKTRHPFGAAQKSQLAVLAHRAMRALEDRKAAMPPLGYTDDW
jgi:GAF domain-containing protein